jgi:hypothetical protein
MGTTSEKLTFLSQTKADIRDAIINKGVTVPANTTFRDYATKINEIPLGGGGEVAETYQRSLDWLPMPSVVEGTFKIAMLVKVNDSGSNNMCFRTSCGNYTMDWGDGVVENFVSNTTAEHVFNYANHAGTDTDRGYRQSMVVVTLQNGETAVDGNINFTVLHSKDGTKVRRSPILEIKMSAPTCTTVNFYGSTSTNILFYCEQIDWIGTNKLTNGQNLFRDMKRLHTIKNFYSGLISSGQWFFFGCENLQNIPPLTTSSITDFGSFFYNCKSLKVLPSMNFANATILSYAFFGCESLKSIPLIDTSNVTTMLYAFSASGLETIPLLNTSKVTSFQLAFKDCKSLKYVPAIDVSLATTVQDMFNSCEKLEKVDIVWNMPNCTGVFQLFLYCYKLKYVKSPIQPKATGVPTTMYNIFNNCHSLINLPMVDLSYNGNNNSILNNCQGVEIVPAFDIGNTVNINNQTFIQLLQLRKFLCINIRYSLWLENTLLNRNAIITIFNNLVTTTGQTLTLSSPYVGELTQADKDIALNKGWALNLNVV